MKKLLFATALSLSLFATFAMPMVVLAVSDQLTSGVSNQSVNNVSGGTNKVVNPLGVDSVCGLIKSLLGAAIAIGIPIAVLFIVWAGFKFVLARGKSEDLVAARNNMLWTVIGIAIFLGAWLLASVIANTVDALQQGSGQPSVISCT